MAIIMPEPFKMDDRTVAISDVALMIEYAMTSDEEVNLYSLAEDIVDLLRPRSGASLVAMHDWLERFKAEHPGSLSKPRIRVRAATQHTA